MAGKRRKNSEMNQVSAWEEVPIDAVPSPAAVLDRLAKNVAGLSPVGALEVRVPTGRDARSIRNGLRNGLLNRGLTNLAFTIGKNKAGTECVYVWKSRLVHPEETEQA